MKPRVLNRAQAPGITRILLVNGRKHQRAGSIHGSTGAAQFTVRRLGRPYLIGLSGPVRAGRLPMPDVGAHRASKFGRHTTPRHDQRGKSNAPEKGSRALRRARILITTSELTRRVVSGVGLLLATSTENSAGRCRGPVRLGVHPDGQATHPYRMFFV